MTIVQQLEAVSEEICDNYCKMPEQWKKEHNLEDNEFNEDRYFDVFTEHVCNNCPLNKIR